MNVLICNLLLLLRYILQKQFYLYNLSLKYSPNLPKKNTFFYSPCLLCLRHHTQNIAASQLCITLKIAIQQRGGNTCPNPGQHLFSSVQNISIEGTLAAAKSNLKPLCLDCTKWLHSAELWQCKRCGRKLMTVLHITQCIRNETLLIL